MISRAHIKTWHVAKVLSMFDRDIFARLVIYQSERFPVLKHGMLIAAFGSSALCVSAMLRRSSSFPDAAAILIAIAVLFIFFFQLRVADEFKDHDEDCQYRPDRPVPRGLISLNELRNLAIIGAIAQVGLTYLLSPLLIPFLLLAWGWFALMSAEFFVPNWLKSHPIIYLVSHMLVMPLLDLFATACDWIPKTSLHTPDLIFGLTAFLILSFVNGTIIEFGRKCWAPSDEIEGVDTYSKLWGTKRTTWLIGLSGFIALVLCLCVNIATQANITWMIGPTIAFAYLIFSCATFLKNPVSKSATTIETASGLCVLASYLCLGFLPAGVSSWIT